MKNKKKYNLMSIVILVLILGIGWNSSDSRAAERKYPDRPIQLIFGYQPGGTDVSFRPFTEKLSEYLGQSIAYIYKPGASGVIGASFVKNAKPDGYTLLGTSQTPIIFTPITQEGAGYSLDDFTAICGTASSSIMLAVRANAPWKTLKDIVEEARKSPGKLTYSTSTILGSNHIAMEMFTRQAKIDMTHVPYKGSAPAVTALLQGEVDMACSNMPPFIPFFSAGKLRPIAVFNKGKERIRGFSNVPTLTELGYPVVHVVFYGLLAPKGTPEEVVRTISTGLKKVVDQDKDFIEGLLDKMSLNLNFLMPKEFAATLKEYNEEWGKIIRDLMKPMKK
jgi:tripartite-type tricarboxylate transporter receptor subunit TctC